MRSFYVILLSFLIVSCQHSKPTEMDLYKSSKVADSQELESHFNKQVAENIDAQKNAPITADHFMVADKTISGFKKSLATLRELTDNTVSIKQKKNNSEDIPLITASTTSDELAKLDSAANTAIAQNQQKIDNGALLLNVRNYQDTYKKVQELANKYDLNIVKEQEHTTDFHKGNFMEIQVAPENFQTLVTEFKNLAVIIRKKYIWQQSENQNFLKIQSQIASSKANIIHLESQLASMTSVDDKLRVQSELAKAGEALDLLVLTTKTTINNKPYSSISLSFFQNVDLAKPATESFSADFSSNLVIGFANFKQFLLDAALVWPYVILGLLFVSIAALAIRSSRKKERQFKLQLLHAQNVQPRP